MEWYLCVNCKFNSPKYFGFDLDSGDNIPMMHKCSQVRKKKKIKRNLHFLKRDMLHCLYLISTPAADIIIVSVNIYLFSRFQKVTTLRIISYTMLIRQIIWRHTFQPFKGTFVMIHLITFRNNEVLTLTTCPLTAH